MKPNSKADTTLLFKESIFLCAKAGLHPFLLNPQKIFLQSKDEKEKAEYVLNQFLHEVQFFVSLIDYFFKININQLHRENFSSWDQ